MRLSVLLALVAIAGCSDRAARQAADPRIADASRPLVFLTHPNEPPHSFRDDSGEIVGTEVDLARKIAAKMGRRLVVEGVDFADIIARLKAGTADFGIAMITITDARQRDVDFSRPYETGGTCFLYMDGGTKPRMSQIPSLRIGVQSDTTEDLYLCRHGCDPIRFPSVGEAVMALESNKLVAVFADIPHLKSIAGKAGGRFALTSPETRDRYGVAVDKRRPDVLAAANAVPYELVGTGKCVKQGCLTAVGVTC